MSSTRKAPAKERHTQKSLRALPAREERYEVGIERGLLLEIHPSGEKTWRYRYRFQGRRPKLTLGRFAATDAEPGMTLQAARIKLAEAEKLLLAGRDPLQEAKEERRAQEAEREIGSFGAVAAEWLRLEHRPANQPRSNGKPLQDEVYLDRDVLPKLGSRQLDEIEPTDVWECVDVVRRRGHAQAALRVRGVIKRVFDYATLRGYRGLNPATVIKPKNVAPRSQRKRALDFDELPQWLDELYASSMSRMMKLAFHSLLLVPARKTEWLHAPWSEFDLNRGYWDLPAERSKTRVAIRHKLPRQLLEILDELKRLSGGSQWVFPSNRGRRDRPVSKSAINTALKAMRHTLVPFVPHDLRRTVRTGMADIGIDEATAERCLNHNKVNVYDRSVRLEVRAKALQKWANHLEMLQRDYTLKKLESRKHP